jgi:hypothetical protein
MKTLLIVLIVGNSGLVSGWVKETPTEKACNEERVVVLKNASKKLSLSSVTLAYCKNGKELYYEGKQ